MTLNSNPPRARAGKPQITALAYPDPETQTVTIILDAATANAAMFAIAAHADEREAHIREVEQFGRSLPEGSYGRRNRQAIAARETRIAARLRAVEQAYRTANERDAMFKPPEPTRAFRSPAHVADRDRAGVEGGVNYRSQTSRSASTTGCCPECGWRSCGCTSAKWQPRPATMFTSP